MKKLIIILLVASTTFLVLAQPTWPQQTERNRIMSVIASINQQSERQEAAIREQFTAMGAQRSSAFTQALDQAESNRKNAIVQYLRQFGTPVSYQVYQEMFGNAA